MSYTCPCCGYKTFSEPRGSYEICPVCNWEDDIVQADRVDFAGGANKPSLREAQKTFIVFGASDKRFIAHVRTPKADEPKDLTWVPLK